MGLTISNTIQTHFSNFPSFYEASWPFIDALVFVLIFVGLARAVFEKRFPGRGGKAMIVGVGLSLAIGMVWAEVEYGFSLKSFGPMAAGIVLLLLLTMLFQVGRTMGFSRKASLGLMAFLGLPLAVQIVPELVGLIGQILPIVLLFWLASAALTGQTVWKKTLSPVGDRNDFKVSGQDSSPKETKNLKSLDREEKRDSRDAYRQSKRVIRILQRIRSQLERKGITPEELDAINHDLKKVAQSEHEMVVDMEKLHQTVERLSKAEDKLFLEARVVLRNKGAYRTSQDQENKDRIARQLTLQQAIETLREQCRRYDEAFVQAVRQTVSAIQTHRVSEAIRWIDNALHWERRAQHILEDIRHVHGKAHSLLRRQIRHQD